MREEYEERENENKVREEDLTRKIILLEGELKMNNYHNL